MVSAVVFFFLGFATMGVTIMYISIRDEGNYNR